MNLHSSAQYLIIYGIFIVWNQVFAIHVVFQVAHGTTPTFKVLRDMLEINICGFLRCIWRFLTKIYQMFKYKSTRWKRFQPSGKYCHHEEDFEIEKDFDHFDDPILPNVNSAVGNIWLELREHFNVTTKATCFIAEKMSQIIDSDWKLFSSVLRKSFVESGIREIDH